MTNCKNTKPSKATCLSFHISNNRFKAYKDKSRNAMLDMKAHCDNDTFITECRTKAKAIIAKATRANGSLNWSILPKLIGQNTKISKDVASLDTDLEIWGLSLAPHFISGFNTCNGMSLGCAEACLMFTGMGQKFMIAADGDHKVAIARIVRTVLWFKYRDQFKAKLLKEISNKAKLLASKNIAMAFRPNVFSEIKFEKLFPELFELCEQLNIQCYDYVKDINRIVENPIGPKYHMTFSLSENNALFIPTALKHGASIAVVTDIPTNKTKNRKAYKYNPPSKLTISGITLDTVDGDQHDARFLDTKRQAFVVLRGKGQAIKSDTTSFMQRIYNAA
tara:strand:- start:727 stop:1731 length:1005 start_codon:yes stop_codon:yes gene_type:complete